MNFRSDNASGIAPKIFDAIKAADHSTKRGYGGDEHCQTARDLIRARFEAPEAEVFFVPTGTAANALALSALTRPWNVIFCHDLAHIYAEEAGAPEFYTGGNQLRPVQANLGKICPSALDAAIQAIDKDATGHMQAGAVSITNINEFGLYYTAEETAGIGAIAKRHQIPLHLDGARFANAAAIGEASPAALTWQAGVDALSLGGTKNGGMNVEAVVIFDRERARNLAKLRKRAGVDLSKGQYLGAQFVAFMENDYWLELAAHANAMMAILATGLKAKGIQFQAEPEANLLFALIPRGLHKHLQKAGAVYYLEPATQAEHGSDEGLLTARFVTSWSTTEAEIEQLLAFF